MGYVYETNTGHKKRAPSVGAKLNKKRQIDYTTGGVEMPKLYELTGMYNQLWDLVEDEEMDLVQLEEALKSVEEDINAKAENLAKIIKQIDGDVTTIKAEIDRLTTKKKTLENKKDSIKAYLEEQLGIAGIDKVKTPLFTVAMQNNPPSLEVVNESLIPKMFYIVPDPVLDKTAVKDLLKRGEEIPGVRLVQGRSLRIR